MKLLSVEEIEAIKAKHKGTIHTREFPTTCYICRSIATMEAALKVVEAANQIRRTGYLHCANTDSLNGKLLESLKPFQRGGRD